MPVIREGGSKTFGESETLNKSDKIQWSPNGDGVTLAWNELSVYVNTREKGRTVCKRIINGVTGAVRAGSLVALIGSSGSGKSTLMSALAHRNPSGVCVEGDILINGRQIGDYMKYLSAFIYQNDIFLGSLTVWEHMNVMAHLKLDRSICGNERNLRINQILESLDLLKCSRTLIGSNCNEKTLSSGERKRLAFATEIVQLLTDPPVYFCDEPTTGLDSYSARKLITMMNLMVCNGKTILCSIHQPSSEIFAMFSQLILLVEGRIAFIGGTGNAIEFFEKIGYKCPRSYNPADFFIKTLSIPSNCINNSKQTIKRICDQFAVSDYYEEIDVVVRYEFHMSRSAVEAINFKYKENFKKPSCWSQIAWLTLRWFLEIIRNPSVQILRICQKIILAIIIGLCYFNTNPTTQHGIQSVQGVIFMLITENTFVPMYGVLQEFPRNYPLFLREYESGLYPPSIYYLSRILAMLPGLIIEPLLFTTIVYWMSGLRPTIQAFLSTTLVTILTMNVATACGVFFSNAFNASSVAMSYLVPFDYLLMITSGVFLHLSSLPTVIKWTKYISWFMYSTETMSIIQWGDITNITCELSNPDIPCLRNGTAILEKYNFSITNMSRDLFNLIVLFFGFYLLGYLCMRWKIKNK